MKEYSFDRTPSITTIVYNSGTQYRIIGIVMLHSKNILLSKMNR